jgi:hypothetical protein
MLIKCLDFRRLSCGTFEGFADIYIVDYRLEIYGCTLHVKDGKSWINMPSRAYKNIRGDEKFSPIVRFANPGEYKEFCEEAKRVVQEFIDKEENEL